MKLQLKRSLKQTGVALGFSNVFCLSVDVNTLTTSTSAGERDFMSRATTESNFQYYLDNSEPPSTTGDVTCDTTSPYINCAYALDCVPDDPINYDCYYEADDGARWYFECLDKDAMKSAANDLQAHCN